LGSARVMGFDLMKNFNRPYFAKNISEFWKRWHISLSTWFRDYLYIPLGGNRVPTYRRYFNLFITFMISGLWHGASWNFVIWGALHGIYLVIGQITKETQQKVFGLINNKTISNIIENLITTSLVIFAWIFFRAKTFSEAKYIIKNFFVKSSHSVQDIINLIGEKELVVILVGLLVLQVVEWMQRTKDMGAWAEGLPRWKRWGIYYFLLAFLITFGYFGEVQFIYFQF
jgi:alginate O-acetyltransferase complex protein AlgI